MLLVSLVAHFVIRLESLVVLSTRKKPDKGDGVIKSDHKSGSMQQREASRGRSQLICGHNLHD